jgi:hypothetical protein
MHLALKMQRPMSQQKKLITSVAIIFVALLVVIRGYNLYRAQPSERYFYHVIPIALSVLYFHWPYDYTGSATVEKDYTSHGRSHGMDYVLSHRGEHQDSKEVYYWTADDRGALDMTVAGFYLFGPKISSMAYLYCLVLAVTVIVFCLSHRESITALRTLAIALLSLGVCFGIWNFINKSTSSGFGESVINLSESRLFGLLAFFAVLSLYFALVQKKQLSAWQLAGATFQALLYAELLHSRMSVLWLLPPLGLIAVAGIFSCAITPIRRNAYAILALISLAIIAKSAYEHAVYNPAYYAERGSRTIWHNVLMGLSSNPFFGKELGIIKVTDPVAAQVVARYERSGTIVPENQHLSAAQLQEVDDEVRTAMNSLGNYGTYDWPKYEREARSYVLAVFKAYPGQFLITFFWYKPGEVLSDIALFFLPHSWTESDSRALPMIYPALIVLFVVALAGRGAFGGTPQPSPDWTMHKFMVLCLIFSAAIPIAFYPAPTQLGDLILVLLVWGYTSAYRLVASRATNPAIATR